MKSMWPNRSGQRRAETRSKYRISTNAYGAEKTKWTTADIFSSSEESNVTKLTWEADDRRYVLYFSVALSCKNGLHRRQKSDDRGGIGTRDTNNEM